MTSTGDSAQRTVTVHDLEAILGFLHGFVDLFTWANIDTPRTFWDIVERFPPWVRYEIEERCADAGFPDAFEDQEWEYMRAAGTTVDDLIERLRAALG